MVYKYRLCIIIASGSYYTEAVRWALSMGITSGTSKAASTGEDAVVCLDQESNAVLISNVTDTWTGPRS